MQQRIPQKSSSRSVIGLRLRGTAPMPRLNSRGAVIIGLGAARNYLTGRVKSQKRKGEAEKPSIGSTVPKKLEEREQENGQEWVTYFSEEEQKFYDEYFPQSAKRSADIKTKPSTKKLISLKEIAFPHVREQAGEIVRQFFCAVGCKNETEVWSNLESLMALYECSSVCWGSKEAFVEQVISDVLSGVSSGLLDKFYAQLLFEPTKSDGAIAADLALMLRTVLLVNTEGSVEQQQRRYLDAIEHLRKCLLRFKTSTCQDDIRAVADDLINVNATEFNAIRILRRGVAVRAGSRFSEQVFKQLMAVREELGHRWNLCPYYKWFLRGLPNAVLVEVLEMASNASNASEESVDPISGIELDVCMAIYSIFRNRITNNDFSLRPVIHAGYLEMQLLPLLNESCIGFYTLKNVYAQYERLLIAMQNMDQVDLVGFGVDESELSAMSILLQDNRDIVDQFAILLIERFKDVQPDMILRDIHLLSLSDLDFLRQFARRFWPHLLPHVLKVIAERKERRPLSTLLDNKDTFQKEVTQLNSRQLLKLLKIIERYPSEPQYSSMKACLLNTIIDRVEQQTKSVIVQLLDYSRCREAVIQKPREPLHSEMRFNLDDRSAMKDILFKQVQLLILSGLVPDALGNRISWDVIPLYACCSDSNGVDQKIIPQNEGMLSIFFSASVMSLQKDGVLQEGDANLLLNEIKPLLHSLIWLRGGPTQPELEVFQFEALRRKAAQLTLPPLVTDS